MKRKLLLNGLALKRRQRAQVYAHFTERHTGQHAPDWVLAAHKRRQYPRPQYSTDYQWLRHSWFYMTKAGELDWRFKHWRGSSLR